MTSSNRRDVLTGLTLGTGTLLGARVAAAAESGEILVSSTVTHLVAGSGISFEDRGERSLKGIQGTWRLFAVSSL